MNWCTGAPGRLVTVACVLRWCRLTDWSIMIARPNEDNSTINPFSSRNFPLPSCFPSFRFLGSSRRVGRHRTVWLYVRRRPGRSFKTEFFSSRPYFAAWRRWPAATLNPNARGETSGPGMRWDEKRQMNERPRRKGGPDWSIDDWQSGYLHIWMLQVDGRFKLGALHSTWQSAHRPA